MRRKLESVPMPGEAEVRERARTVVLSAFAEREPVPRRSQWPRVAVIAIAVSALGAAALSSPGRAVLHELREVVGVKRAQPALFSLPAPGRLLVSSDAGVWVVEQDGSKRLLGDYREASWSPFGRFVVAAKQNELAALERDGDVRWTLARPAVSDPAWGGSETDTRIAYRSGNRVRVVAGDGTGDRPLARDTAGVPPAWRPGGGHVLTYATRNGDVVTIDTGSGRLLWRRPGDAPVAGLEWSSDGRRLLVRRDVGAEILTRDGQPFTGFVPPNGRLLAAALRPGSHAVAYALESGGRTQVLVDGEPGGLVFSGPGRSDELAWSPDGRWLLVGWRAADQWVFVRPGTRSVQAAAHVAEQFRSSTFPTLAGWCCASSR